MNRVVSSDLKPVMYIVASSFQYPVKAIEYASNVMAATKFEVNCNRYRWVVVLFVWTVGATPLLNLAPSTLRCGGQAHLVILRSRPLPQLLEPIASTL